MQRTIILLFGALAASSAMAAGEVTYRQDIRPLWQARCVACHGAQSPYLGDFLEKQDDFVKQSKGPRMDTYADLIFFVGWPDTGAIMRRLDDGKSLEGGRPGNMYQHLGSTEEERQKNLQLFKAWVGSDAWTYKRWDARGDMPGVSKDELEKMKLKY